MDCYNLTVIKLEGLGDTKQINCCIYLDDKLICLVPMSDAEVDSVLITRGKLKIILEDYPSSQLIASLSFNSQIFQRSGFH